MAHVLVGEPVSTSPEHALVAGTLAAADVQGLTGHEGSPFQEHDRVDNVADFTHASDRMQLGQELVSFGSMHRRLDYAGRDRFRSQATWSPRPIRLW